MNPSEALSREHEGEQSSDASSAFARTSANRPEGEQRSNAVDIGVAVANVASALAEALRVALRGDLVDTRERVRGLLVRLETLTAGREESEGSEE